MYLPIARKYYRGRCVCRLEKILSFSTIRQNAFERVKKQISSFPLSLYRSVHPGRVHILRLAVANLIKIKTIENIVLKMNHKMFASNDGDDDENKMFEMMTLIR